MHDLLLPVPGPVWGLYPQRSDDESGELWNRVTQLAPSLPSLRGRQQFMLALRRLRDEARQGTTRVALPARQLMVERVRGEGFAPDICAELLLHIAEACKEDLGLYPHSEQFMAAWVMLNGGLAEMATGEGKTIAAAMAACAAGIAGVPVHVITANDYLVERDAAAMKGLFERFALSVAWVGPAQSADQRRLAYRADVTYCTAKELGFDYLRDIVAQGSIGHDLALRAQSLDVPKGRVLRGLCLAIIDEADNILIDEARVPMIISRPAPGVPITVLELALKVANQLELDLHFKIDASHKSVELTQSGRDRLTRMSLPQDAQWRNPRQRDELVSLALYASHLLVRDRDYLVQDEAIVLIDPSTGRPVAGREWSRGLHQFLALKEGVKPAPITETIAQITFQALFARYHCLGGMSGSLAESRVALATLYGLRLTPIPRHLPRRWEQGPTRVFLQRTQVWRAVARRVREMQALGRPVLIGTDSLSDSESLAAALGASGLSCQVLNARQDKLENHIIACAGQADRVTVATQMAGRGTDILLGSGVAERGGLHVICCQFAGVRRLHRQLLGRAGRQGDPGSGEVMLCLSEGLLALKVPQSVCKLVRRACLRRGELPLWLGATLSAMAQRIEEFTHFIALWRLRQQDRSWRKRIDFAGTSE